MITTGRNSSKTGQTYVSNHVWFDMSYLHPFAISVWQTWYVFYAIIATMQKVYWCLRWLLGNFLQFVQWSTSCFVMLEDGCDPRRDSFQVNITCASCLTDICKLVSVWFHRVTTLRCRSTQRRAWVLKLACYAGEECSLNQLGSRNCSTPRIMALAIKFE